MLALRQKAGSLTEVANAYIAFLDHAGKAPDPNLEQHVSRLCSRECTKIVNNEIIFSTSDAFAEQLRKAHDTFGKWQINKNYRVDPSATSHSFTIKYIAETELRGIIIAMAIITVSSAYLITEIDEVYTEKEQKK